MAEYNVIGGRPHVVKRWRGKRWTWKAGIEWKAADLWVGVFHRRIAGGREWWFCLLPCLPFHIEYWAHGGDVDDHD